MDQLWFLAEIDILQDLAPAELEQIAARAPMQSVPAGAVFYSPERAAEVLFITPTRWEGITPARMRAGGPCSQDFHLVVCGGAAWTADEQGRRAGVAPE